MRTLLRIVILALGVGLGWWWASPPANTVSVPEGFLDSLREVASRPPLIEWRDSTVYRDTTIYRTRYVPIPVESTDTSAYYEDTYKDAHLRFTVRDSVVGSRIVWREWDHSIYYPVHFHTKVITETLPMPYPAYRKRDLWYAGGSLGTDGWRVRGGKELNRLELGLYVGRVRWEDQRIPAIGIETTLKF